MYFSRRAATSDKPPPPALSTPPPGAGAPPCAEFAGVPNAPGTGACELKEGAGGSKDAPDAARESYARQHVVKARWLADRAVSLDSKNDESRIKIIFYGGESEIEKNGNRY